MDLHRTQPRGPAVGRGPSPRCLLSRTCHSISQQSGRRFGFKHCFSVSTNPRWVIPQFGEETPSRAHAQARRVPAIASPRILRPIYTHTPATGFPHPGTSRHRRVPDWRRSRIAFFGRFSLPLRTNTFVQWRGGSPTFPKEEVSATRIGRRLSMSRAGFLPQILPFWTTSLKLTGNSHCVGQSDRVSRSTSRACSPCIPCMHRVCPSTAPGR